MCLSSAMTRVAFEMLQLCCSKNLDLPAWASFSPEWWVDCKKDILVWIIIWQIETKLLLNPKAKATGPDTGTWTSKPQHGSHAPEPWDDNRRYRCESLHQRRSEAARKPANPGGTGKGYWIALSMWVGGFSVGGVFCLTISQVRQRLNIANSAFADLEPICQKLIQLQVFLDNIYIFRLVYSRTKIIIHFCSVIVHRPLSRCKYHLTIKMSRPVLQRLRILTQQFRVCAPVLLSIWRPRRPSMQAGRPDRERWEVVAWRLKCWGGQVTSYIC